MCMLVCCTQEAVRCDSQCSMVRSTVMCGVCLCECIVGRGEGFVGREHGLGGLI